MPNLRIFLLLYENDKEEFKTDTHNREKNASVLNCYIHLKEPPKLVVDCIYLQS